MEGDQQRQKSSLPRTKILKHEQTALSPITENELVDHRQNAVGSAHPCLSIREVLETIFNFIIIAGNGNSTSSHVVDDVRSLRGVCRTWRNEATRIFRRVRAPMVFENRNNDYFSHQRLPTFTRAMETSQMIPVQKYEFAQNYFANDENQIDLKDFLRVCGKEAVSLRFSFSDLTTNWHSKTPTQTFNLNGFDNLNLEKLEILKLSFLNKDEANGQSFGLSLANFLGLLLTAAKGLREFHFYMAWPSCEEQAKIRAEPFELNICKGISKTVKKLRVENLHLTDLFFNTLTETGVKLTELAIDSFSIYESDIIRKFFDNQTYTLKVLNISTTSWPPPTTSIEFPRMNELVHLKLDSVPVANFSFRDTFPKLEGLDMWWGLRALNATYFAEVLSYSKRAAPSLRKIKLPDISSHAPTTPLTLYKKISKVFSYNKPDMRWYQVNIQSLNYQRHKIYLHSELKKFDLSFSYSTIQDSRLILTDVSAHFVFLRMANLEELSLTRAKMSSRHIQLLMKRFTVRTLNGSSMSLMSETCGYSDNDENDSDDSD